MKLRTMGLLAVVIAAAPLTINANTLASTEQIFSFDLRSNVPAPPYTAIQFFTQFAASDPVLGSDSLQLRSFGDLNGGGLITSTVFPSVFYTNGGTVLNFSTANAIYDPMLDGVFSIGLTMLSGTADLTSFRACGISQQTIGPCSVPSGVPEPGTLALLGFGLVGLAASRHRKA